MNRSMSFGRLPASFDALDTTRRDRVGNAAAQADEQIEANGRGQLGLCVPAMR